MKKTTKCTRQNIRQNKRKQNHQEEFLTTQKKNWSRENGDQSSLFSDGLRKVNFTKDYLSNKLFKLKWIKLMTNIKKNISIKSNNNKLARDRLNIQTHLRPIQMDQIKSRQTIIFNLRINFINELILWKIPKLNWWGKLNQNKLRTFTFEYRIDFINNLKLLTHLK